MRRLFRPPHRHVLLRFYALLAGGLIAAAALLDLLAARLLPAPVPEAPWQVAALQLLDDRLAQVDAPDLLADSASYEQELGTLLEAPVAIYARDRVAQAPAPGTLLSVAAASSEATYLYGARGAPVVVRLSLPSTPEPAWRGWLPLLFYGAIFLLVGWWLSPLFRDLEALSAAADDFAADYRQPLRPLHDVTQLTGLAASLQSMAERIRGLITAQQAMTHALSHEIRTPLARMKFALALDAPGSERQAHAELSANIDAIEALLQAMLTYARLERAEQELHVEPFAVLEWAAQFEGNLPGRSLAPELEVLPGDAAGALAEFSGDGYLLALAVSNLLANAARYARDRVRLTVAREPAGLRLTVDDDGPGVPPAERTAVFTAFRQPADAAAPGGSGLGLAVVARIADLHGGTATVETSPLGGARFLLQLPDAF